MDILTEIRNLYELRQCYVRLYENHEADVKLNKLPPFEYARDNVMFEGECLLKIYGTSQSLKELIQIALREHTAGNLFIEQTIRDEQLKPSLEMISSEIKNIEKNICERLYRGYEASW